MTYRNRRASLPARHRVASAHREWSRGGAYENPIAANLAAFAPDESAKWLVALGKSFDIFTFWTLILLAVGFAAVNPKKLKGSQTYTIAFGVWAAFVACRVGWAFVFS